AEVPEPVAREGAALALAAADAGGGGSLLEAAGSVRVPAVLSWRYSAPGSLLAPLVGASPRETVVTSTGGNSPQMLLNDTAAAIQRGDVGVALLAGAEAMYTRFRARKAKVWLDWPVQADAEPTAVLGEERPGTSDME